MKCLNCKIELKQIKGKKPRLFCDDACRKAHSRGLKADIKSGQIKSGHSNTDTISLKTDKPEKDTSKYEIAGRSWKKKGKTEPMYYCGRHQEHCKSYCLVMCDNCKHL